MLSDEEREAIRAAVLELPPLTDEQIDALCEVIANARGAMGGAQGPVVHSAGSVVRHRPGGLVLLTLPAATCSLSCLYTQVVLIPVAAINSGPVAPSRPAWRSADHSTSRGFGGSGAAPPRPSQSKRAGGMVAVP